MLSRERLTTRLGATVLVVLCGLFSASYANAQVLYGSVVGTVRDASNAVIPGATIVLTNTGTNQSREAASNEAGNYTFSNVLPGIYRLSVTASGFRNYTQERIEVTVNTVRRVEITLELGQVTETVTVEASALALQTDKADVHVELGEKAVRNLPLPAYRNYQTLINLVPGATPARFQNSVGSTPARALTTNVNGVNRNNNNTKLDGAVNIFIWLPHHTAYVAPAETIETVNISTNNFDAEQGMAGGAAITVATKSGTNEFHGSAFAFHDNQHLRARNFFNPGGKAKSIQNINGFTAGGPIRKDKVFFFGAWEGNRERTGFDRLLTISTPDQRAGNFSAYNAVIFDPATGDATGAGRTPFAGNIIPLSRQSSATRALQDLVPAPNRAGVVNNFFNSGTQALNRDNFDGKVNWNRSDSHQVWGKYSIMDAQVNCEFALGPAGGPGLCNDSGIDSVVITQLATIGHTKTFSPTFLWDAIIGWTRLDEDITTKDFGTNFGSDVFGIPGTNGPDPRQSGLPRFDISGYEPLGNQAGWAPVFYNDTTFTTEQNFSWTKGRHDMRFGFQGLRHHMNHWQPEIGGGPRGRFIFNQGITGLRAPNAPALTQYNSYAAFLLGQPEIAQKSLQWEKMAIFEYQLGWYFRDRWQVTPKLTLSLGLRYELYPLMTRAGRGGIEIWNPDTNIVELGGAGGNPKDLGVGTSKRLFAPRLGIAYRLNDSTVIRTGYGLTYNPMPLARPLRGFFPLVIAKEFNSPNTFSAYAPIEQGIPEFSGPPPNVGQAELPPDALMRFIDGDSLRRGYVQSWNFVVERQLPAGFITSVGYVGTQTVRSFADWNGNASTAGGGQAGRPFFQPFGRTVDTLFWNGFVSANYHSLQLTVNRRVASGLTLKGAYTYSKAINWTDDDGWAGLTWNDPSQMSRNRARAGYDVPHIFQMGWVYELPFGRGKSMANSGVAAAVLGGWQVNGIGSLFQGRPFTVVAAGASLNAPGNTQTADQVKPTVEKLGGIGPGQHFFDPTAFAVINDVRYGTSGRNILRGPGVANLDLGVFRKFALTEKYVLEFRAEAYNSTNTPHFLNPGNNVNTASFMQVLGAEQDQRQFRFGLRLEW